MSCAWAWALRSMTSSARGPPSARPACPARRMLRPAQDRVQRRAELVGERGEELVLHPVGGLGLRAGRVLADQRPPAVVQLLLKPLVQPSILDRVGRDPRVEIHEARLAVRGAVRLLEQDGQHADRVAAPADQGRAVTRAEAGPARRLAVGRVERVRLGVFHHHPPLQVGGAGAAAGRRDLLDVAEELVVEPGVDAEPQARLLRIAEGKQPAAGLLDGHGRSQDFAQDGFHVEETGQTHAGLVKPAKILDLRLQLAEALARVGRAGPGRDDPRVAGADLRDGMREPVAAEPLERVRAEEPEHVRPPELVPQILEAEGGRRVPIREEQADHLAEHAQPASAADGARHLGSDHVREALRIRHPVAHDPREGRLGVEGDVGVHGPRRVQVDAVRAQARLGALPGARGWQRRSRPPRPRGPRR